MVIINNNITILSANTLSNSQQSNSTAKTIAELSIDDIKSLTTAQVSGLTSTQIGELSTAQILGFSTSQIAALSTGQITALSTGQLAALDDNQVDALSGTQISALTLDQTSTFLKRETSGTGSDTASLPPIAQKIARQGYFPDGQIELLSYLSQTALTVAASTAPQPALMQGLVASDIQGLSRQDLASLTPNSSTPPKPFETAKAVAFVDSQIANSDVLIKDLQAKGVTTFVIDHTGDGLTQMANDVLGMSDISSIHVFSHANSGMLNIGSGTVDQNTLATHTSQLQQIGQSLSASGDILLYGCDVAANQAGHDFMAALAQATGADIAASLDETGTKSLGGNWVLESSVGTVESQTLVFDNFQGVLLTPTSLSSSWTVTDISGISNSEIAALTTDQLTGLGNNIRLLSAAQIASLNSTQIMALTTAQVVALTTMQVSSLTNSQLAAFKTEQVVKIATDDLAALQTSQVTAFTSEQLVALTTVQLRAFSTSQFVNFNTSQISVFKSSQISHMKAQLISALTSSQITALTSQQIMAFTTSGIANFGSTQIATLKSSQVAAFSAVQIKSFKARQLSALLTEQINGLTSLQIKTLTSAQLASIQTSSILAFNAANFLADPSPNQGFEHGRVQCFQRRPVCSLDAIPDRCADD